MNLVFYDMIYEPGNQFEQLTMAEIEPTMERKS